MPQITVRPNPAGPGTERPAEFEIELIGAGPHRFALPLRGRIKKGKIAQVINTIIAKSGTNPTKVSTTILDDDDATIPFADVGNHPTRRFRSEDDPVNAAVTPDQVVGHVAPQPIDFVPKGTPETLQVIIEYTGADGTTEYTFNIQVYGDYTDPSSRR